jgi:hypothetical protein
MQPASVPLKSKGVLVNRLDCPDKLRFPISGYDPEWQASSVQFVEKHLPHHRSLPQCRSPRYLRAHSDCQNVL